MWCAPPTRGWSASAWRAGSGWLSADVDRAYQRTLQLGDHARWPCPRGEWEEDAEDGARQFVVHDGRHEYVAALMLRKSHVPVAWIEAA